MRHWAAALLFLVVAAAASAATDDRWLDADAKVRRIVVCEPAATNLPGDDVGLVSFYTGGLAAPGAKDVRVFAASAEPQILPHRVIDQGPGDQVRIAFATPKGVRRYHVYYGNPKVAEPATQLDVRRGLLYEVRTGEAAGAETVATIERAFARGRPQGAAFVDNIFFGFNPFGPSEGFISCFTAYLAIDKPGTYRIATTSDDCSFVLIDDNLVVKWGGVHGPVGDARHNGPVDLSRGLHKLVYWHAQGGSGTVAEAAWQPPGADRFVVIPKEAFTPVAFARLAEIQVAGQGISPDFDAVRVGESWFQDFYPIHLEFRNLTSPATNPGVKYEWDFGDGQTSSLAGPSHVYLRHGEYRVRLAVTWGPQKAEVVNRVVVERNWWKQSMNVVEPLAEYARIVARYDYEKQDVESLSNAADLFAATRSAGERQRVLETLVFRKDGLAEARLLQRAGELAELYRAAGKFGEAVRAYRQAESKALTAASKASAAIAAARVLLDDLGQAAEAEREFRRALKDYGQAPPLVLRAANVGAGDAACVRGEAAAASAAYAAAEKIPLGGLAETNPTLRVSALARYVEEYIRTKDFEDAAEFIRTWYREFPAQRLTGQIPLFEARLNFARERYDKVLRAANELVGVNPQSAFAAELLFLAAEAALKLERTDDARRALAQIVDDYPEYHRRAEAAALLKKLGGPLGPAVKP